MKVLITGGAGYIGAELVGRLINNPLVSEVVVYDNFSSGQYRFLVGAPKYRSEKVDVVQGDILDTRTLKKSLEGVETIYHLAAVVSSPNIDIHSHMFEQVNHWGTAELIHLIENSSSVRKFIHMSSAAVYGAGNDDFDVDGNLNPMTYYGHSKVNAEKQALRVKDKVTTYVVRCSNVYGYSKCLRFGTVINRFMLDAVLGKPVQINGNGKQKRAFINIDCVSNVLDRLLSAVFDSSIINLSEANYSIVEIVASLKELLKDLEFVFVNQHIEMKELKLKKDQLIEPIISEFRMPLLENLGNFKAHFSFI